MNGLTKFVCLKSYQFYNPDGNESSYLAHVSRQKNPINIQMTNTKSTTL